VTVTSPSCGVDEIDTSSGIEDYYFRKRICFNLPVVSRLDEVVNV
jgi:hypothetical protein